MKRSIFLAAVAALGLGGCVVVTTGPVPSPFPAVGSTENSAPRVIPDAPAGSMMALLNAERSARGVGLLIEDARLSRAAQMHADDMVANGYFSHRGQNGSRLTDRARAAGYDCVAGEALAAGQKTRAEAVQAWMDSEPHRRIILRPYAMDFGIGRSADTWVLMTGRGC